MVFVGRKFIGVTWMLAHYVGVDCNMPRKMCLWKSRMWREVKQYLPRRENRECVETTTKLVNSYLLSTPFPFRPNDPHLPHRIQPSRANFTEHSPSRIWLPPNRPSLPARPRLPAPPRGRSVQISWNLIEASLVATTRHPSSSLELPPDHAPPPFVAAACLLRSAPSAGPPG
jgi:hypothetical protein